MELIQVPDQVLLTDVASEDHNEDLSVRFRKVFDIIIESKNIAIISHVNPDGDAIGSALALYHYATGKSKNPVVLMPGRVPNNLEFLPGADKIIAFNPETDAGYLLNADTIFVLDLNQPDRMKQIYGSYDKSKAVKVVIDHHQDPKPIADFYAIDTDASSTGEILLRILKNDTGLWLTPEIAESLYTAIMTDTGSFRYPRTDAELHRIVAGLIDAGADPVKVYDKVYNIASFKRTRLLGEGFSRIESHHDGKMGLVMLTKESFERSGAIEDDVEGFVENILSLKGVFVGILMVEVPERNEIRISFRSKGEYFIKSLARHFGGGGHDYAAGARVKNITLTEARVLVLEQAEKLFAGE